MSEQAAAWLLLAVLVAMPPAVALARGHRHPVRVTLLSVALSWTCVGWLLVLVWAATDPVRPQHGDQP